MDLRKFFLENLPEAIELSQKVSIYRVERAHIKPGVRSHDTAGSNRFYVNTL